MLGSMKEEGFNMAPQFSLKELLEEGESQTLEFKTSLSERREGAEALCAMINTDVAQGMVLFGVRPDGNPCGVEPGNLDSAQCSLSRTVRDKFDPPLVVEIRVEILKGKHIIILSATRSRDTPYHEYDGRTWIRQGTENRRLGISEKQQLTRSRNRDLHPGPWKCDRCGTFVGIFSSIAVTDKGPQKNYQCSCGGEFWPVT